MMRVRRAGPRITVGIGVLVLIGCDEDRGDADARSDPLDIVREQVERAERSAGAVAAAATVPSATSGPAVALVVDELPPPDPSAFVGRTRVVNLWAGPGAGSQSLDVWARRTFASGPVLLAAALDFGAASEYFAAPVNQDVVVVGAGAGPDGLELARVVTAGDGEQFTLIVTNDDDAGAIRASTVFEVDPDGANAPPAPPSDGNGLVVIYAPNPSAFESSLTLAIGAAAFYVGDGRGVCAHQRIEDRGFAPTVLGGTQNVELDLPPGPSRLTLHAWPSLDECTQPSLLDVDVDAVAGSAVLVLVFSRDGTTIEALQLPMPLG